MCLSEPAFNTSQAELVLLVAPLQVSPTLLNFHESTSTPKMPDIVSFPLSLLSSVSLLPTTRQEQTRGQAREGSGVYSEAGRAEESEVCPSEAHH